MIQREGPTVMARGSDSDREGERVMERESDRGRKRGRQ